MKNTTYATQEKTEASSHLWHSSTEPIVSKTYGSNKLNNIQNKLLIPRGNKVLKTIKWKGLRLDLKEENDILSQSRTEFAYSVGSIRYFGSFARSFSLPIWPPYVSENKP